MLGISHELQYLLSSTPTVETLALGRIQTHSFSTTFINYSQRLAKRELMFRHWKNSFWRGSHTKNSRPPSDPRNAHMQLQPLSHALKVEIAVQIHWRGWHAGNTQLLLIAYMVTDASGITKMGTAKKLCNTRTTISTNLTTFGALTTLKELSYIYLHISYRSLRIFK